MSWALIDNYKAELPPEKDQDEQAKLWRLQLHRLDTRNLVQTGRTEEGHIIFQSREPEPDLQALVEEQKPRSAALDSAISLLSWGRSAFEGKAAGDDWREQIPRAQAQIATRAVDESERDLAAGGPAYVAAVCIRDHWPEMSAEEQEWCAQQSAMLLTLTRTLESIFLLSLAIRSRARVQERSP